MSEYFHVEKPFLDQLGALGWTVVDQGHGTIPSAPVSSLRDKLPRVAVAPCVLRRDPRASTGPLTDRNG